MVPSERALKTKSKTGVKSFTPFCLGSSLRKTNSGLNVIYLGKVVFVLVKSIVSFQATAFFLGALSDMPAVRAFALHAAVSLTFNFIL